MNLFERLERRLESLVEAVVSRTLGGPVHPVEIARAVAREVEEQTAGGNGSSPPSHVAVRLHPSDCAALEPILPALRDELEAYLRDRAAPGGDAPAEAPTVEIQPDPGVEAGTIEVVSGLDAADAPGATIGETPAQGDTRIYRLRSDDPPVLEVVDGTQHGARFILAHLPIVLGRADHCGVALNDPAASREHVRIEQSHDGYVLVDLDSTNGTLLNDRPVKEVALREGDRIRIGGTVLEFRGGSA